MVNNTNNKRRVELMARMTKSDDVWNEIFDNLVLESEPPLEYIKNVVITTKTGVRLKVSAFDFAQILERERFISPEESDILSCKLAINFDKVRKDVDNWADQTMYYFDNDGKFKPRAKTTRKKPVAKKETKSAEAIETAAKKTTRTTKATATGKKPTTKKATATTKKTATTKATTKKPKA